MISSSMDMSAVKSANWLAYRTPNARAALRLFCFPFAGGGALIFRKWAEELPESIEVCPVQLPGRETRVKEPAFKNVVPLAKAVASALQPYLDKPFAFFGHSMGALIAFEVTRELRRTYGILPSQLFVSARVAPHLPISREPMHDRPHDEFIQGLRRLKGTDEAVLRDQELMNLVLPLLRADFAVHEAYNYLPENPLDCPVSAFGGVTDTEASRGQLDGWREHTAASFTLQMFPGDHFYIQTARPLVLRTMSRELYGLLK